MNGSTVPSLADRFRGALLGAAIGDALGAPFEKSLGTDRASFSGWEEEAPFPLRYTDDALMTLGTARSLVEREGVFDGAHMAELFAADYEREPRRGYGSGPPQVFARLRAGEPWDRAAEHLFGGRGSYGNGAAMRSAPIGLLHYRDRSRIDEVARAAARITHTHELGQEGAALQAIGVGFLVGAGPASRFDRSALLRTLSEHVRTEAFSSALAKLARLDLRASADEVVEELGNRVEAHLSVPAAWYSFLRSSASFPETIYFAIGLGGDADTIASMAGALSGAFLGASAIPAPWREAVEGADEFRRLADRLLELAAPGASDR